MSRFAQPTASSAQAILPPEILSQVFLQVDPHTLYTSVRALSHSWKECVEQHLLAKEFNSGRWRVGLRVVRKPKLGTAWRGGRAGGRDLEAPGAQWDRVHQHVAQQAEQEGEVDRQRRIEEARHAYAMQVCSRPGALEDELEPVLPSDVPVDQHCAPLVHVIPLQFQKYDGDSTSLHFATPADQMHALFESSSGRLGLDFGIVWRFPGDGQEATEEWGEADPENGWLSRFYCSSFDTLSGKFSEGKEASIQLCTSPLARRVRRAIVSRREDEEDLEEEEEDEEEDVHPMLLRDHSMQWNDQGHEYAALSLSLGVEFFVRRSARANHLLRRLEAEVEAARQAKQHHRHPRHKSHLAGHASASSTPQRSSPSHSATPVTASTRLHQRLALVAAASSSTSRSTAKFGAPSMSSSTCSSGTSTPNTYVPAWRKPCAASYAAMASTPPLIGSSSRAKINTRILSLDPARQPSGSAAPMSSLNVSGYASVQHDAPLDGKAEEQRRMLDVEDSEQEEVEEDKLAKSTVQLDVSASQASTRDPPSRMALSNHHTVPRAQFTARLLRVGRQKGDQAWYGGDRYGRHQVRQASVSPLHPVTIWQWSR